MKLRGVGIAALGFLVGCVRLGYDVQRGVDAVGGDAGMDAAAAGASTGQDAAVFDAAQPSAADLDAATASRDAGGSDSGGPDDAGSARDAAAPRDAGTAHDAAVAIDSGQGDAAAADSGAALCAVVVPVTVTKNTYDGKPHYHGYLTLQNVGDTTWTLPTISFDLASSVNICDSADVLPGAGWTLHASPGHCAYTKTAPALSIAPNATFAFEYSTDYRPSVAEPAVSNVSVTSCP